MNRLHSLKVEKYRPGHWGVVCARIIIIILQFYPINSRVSGSFVISGYNREFKKLLTSFISYSNLFWLINPNNFFEFLKHIKCASR